MEQIQIILSELKKINGDKGFEQVRDYLSACLTGSIPSRGVLLSRITSLHSNLGSERDRIKPLVDQTIGILEAEGYKDQALYLTQQEHRCTGSSGIAEYVTANPLAAYTPLGLIKGSLTLEEAIRARSLATVVRCSLFPGDLFDGISEKEADTLFGNSYFSLEELNSGGRTVCDPQLLDANLDVILGLTHKETFPYRRS